MTIKEIRKCTGMSQSQFASYFGFRLRTLQSWEQGYRGDPEYLSGLLIRILKAERPDLVFPCDY